MYFPYKAILPNVLMPKSGKLESHAPFRDILKVKRNFEIVSERAMFEESCGWVGGAVGVGSGWFMVGKLYLACRRLPYSRGQRYTHLYKKPVFKVPESPCNPQTKASRD